ncbi:MAG: hypothetical protein KDC07_00195 [Chitinophagaceae bacterium]|nr:hypothetical protein [Chitinophagaceae bacterium]MCB9044877.1 hypothetical protein [Chitinophagales bacterium]
MQSKFITLLVMFMLGTGIMGYAQQDLKDRQKKQEKEIKAAYKKKKVSELEYNKLMREQEIIKQAMEDYAADDVWTSKEKNAIYGKLERAEKRLRKYKTNHEIY